MMYNCSMETEYYTIQQVAKQANLSRQAIDKRIKVRKVLVRIFGKTRVVTADDREKLLS